MKHEEYMLKKYKKISHIRAFNYEQFSLSQLERLHGLIMSEQPGHDCGTERHV